jgi:hypothetical protein
MYLLYNTENASMIHQPRLSNISQNPNRQMGP